MVTEAFTNRTDQRLLSRQPRRRPVRRCRWQPEPASGRRMRSWKTIDAAASPAMETIPAHAATSFDRGPGRHRLPARADPQTAARRRLARGTGRFRAACGARELKRTILRMITQPVAAMVDREEILPGSIVRVEACADGERLNLVVEDD